MIDTAQLKTLIEAHIEGNEELFSSVITQLNLTGKNKTDNPTDKTDRICAAQLKQLIKSHVKNDEAYFLAIAMQLARSSGPGKDGTPTAKDISDLIDDAKHPNSKLFSQNPNLITHPYFVTNVHGKSAKLYLGDSLKILKEMPSESIDMVFADPPYNLSNGGFSCHAGKRVSVNKGKWDESRGINEDFKFHSSWIEQCKRVLKPNGTLWVSGTYHSIYSCGFALQTQGWHIINDIAWLKPNAAPNLSCRMFTASHETLIWARKDKKAKHTFNYQEMKNGDFPKDFIKKQEKQMRSVWAIGTPLKNEKKYGKHPTQKPQLLLERIITASTNPGDTILDPFCGSASTGIAALKCNREFIGIDAEQEYLDELAIPKIIDLMKN